MKKALCGALAGIAIMAAGSASAVTFTFEDFDGVDDGGPGVAPQIQLDVTQVGASALFYFQNLGSLASSITHIVFSDPGNLVNALAGIDNSDLGVDFAVSSQNMPQWTGLEEFGVRSTSPRSQNGIQPGEYLGLTFSLTNSFQDLIDSLNSETFRVVMHVQQLNGTKGSDVLVSTTPVPLPAAGMMLLMALGGVAAMGRRRTAAAA